MKKIILLALALSTTCGSGVAQASGTVVQALPLTQFHMPIATFKALAKSQMQLVGTRRGNIVQPDSPAPALSEIAIIDVCEPQGCEQIGSSSTSTANVFTGTDVQPIVLEVGYGTGEIATQAGTQLPSADLLAKVSVCQSGNELTTSCPAGSLVVGFLYDWEVGTLLSEGFGGNFTANDTSATVPINTLRVGINIQYQR